MATLFFLNNQEESIGFNTVAVASVSIVNFITCGRYFRLIFVYSTITRDLSRNEYSSNFNEIHEARSILTTVGDL